MTTSAPRAGAVLPALAALAVAAQLYGLYRVTGPPSPPWFPHVDKLEHGLGFALPTALVLTACAQRAERRGRELSRRGWAVVLTAFATHAVLSELVQRYFYTTRTGDPLDVVADWAGVAAGAVAVRALLSRHRRRRDPPATPALPARDGAR